MKKKRKETLLRENNRLEEKHDIFSHLIGADKGLKDIVEQVKAIAPYDINVLLIGETGTGKEVIADLIHSLSNRSKESYVKINCASIPDELIESELFGHKKGAFTGASADRKGKFEMADGGTLFLDEIGELKLDLQVKLLRVIQEKKLQRVGNNIDIDIDFRLICATNIDLHQAQAEKKFREDLFYRINTITIDLPPLRNRVEDLPELIRFFTGKYCCKFKLPPKILEEGVLENLMELHWHGNIRELENTIQRAVVMAAGTDVIGHNHFCMEKKDPWPQDYVYAIKQLSRVIRKKKKSLKDIEQDLLAFVLNFFENNVYQAAEKTGITRDRFYRHRKNLIAD